MANFLPAPKHRAPRVGWRNATQRGAYVLVAFVLRAVCARAL